MYDSVIQLLKDKATPACVLLTIIFDEYGSDFLDWEPEVLRLEILSDFGVELSPVQSDKLQAAATIISSDHFEFDWHTFNCCIHGLNGEPFDYEDLYPIDAEQIVAAMPEIEMLTTNFFGVGARFSDEVNVYTGLIFSEYGLFFAPDEFPTAIMPSLPGEHYSDSQAEKKEALAELYTHKKAKLKEYMNCLEHVFTV
jgi:hypothetical protein